MKKVPLKVEKRLQLRKEEGSLRELRLTRDMVDFSSNDYLGLNRNSEIFSNAHELLLKQDQVANGSGGSRLLTGNHPLYKLAEDKIAAYHSAEAALIFNSGFDANLGFFGSLPQRNDIILYDELSHASIRDGILLGKAKAYKFRHNDLKDLAQKIHRSQKISPGSDIYIVTEAVFSMDGDAPDLKAMAIISAENNCFFVVDEAHSVGVMGTKGCGLVEELGIQELVFARLITYGKAFGAHGAAILGSEILRNYLINFARSFIYTTALPPHSLATMLAAYQHLEQQGTLSIQKLQENIHIFKTLVADNQLESFFIKSDSAIHCCLISGNERVKKVALEIQAQGFDVRPILSPTVPLGKERLRFCIHSFNTREQMETVVSLLRKKLL